ncbi:MULTISPECIES: LytTR family DNA-binding domain-containing protein [unclassified Granulicatella]|uniref:LytTR family DNA-binding domain-containing protein n=1 Tax=unclassified Granulicatella TaxID=2630493 RepID=UPI0010743915|nr:MULTISPECIES: LytTR family DNA-binding domain-containing protein [unclassified Granulicatella]MBF0780228.1 LytTR family transcriptional regulator [Granulicatella sp. 19428wC4_WM01]TFU95662.1 LytTR family transcriptional regulator [Granulicatella sp. WM01]
MKIKIEIDDAMDDLEVIIKAKQLDEDVIAIQKRLNYVSDYKLSVFKQDSEYFIPIQEILFIEANDSRIYVHTIQKIFESHEKLYQLEAKMPIQFCRISKSVLVNIKAIYALDRSFSGTSTIRFAHCHKQVHVSRHYYKFLKDKLNEMRYLYEN